MKVSTGSQATRSVEMMMVQRSIIFIPGFYLLIKIGIDELWINIRCGPLFARFGSNNPNESTKRPLIHLACWTIFDNW